MARAEEIYGFLERLAPVELAESYDNVGLLAGSGGQRVTKALIALDITKQVCEEAASKGAQLIVSHHPVIFRPVNSVLKDGATAVLWELVQSGLTAICMHTNLDVAEGGVNDTLAQVLSLKKSGILSISGSHNYKKITVFVPEEYAGQVRLAMAQAGAGRLGRYDSCAFETTGTGYFRPLDGARPFIGETDKLTSVKEVRLEAVCSTENLSTVLKALRRAHPYEEPAYDIFDDAAINAPYGIGMISDLDEDTPLDDFAQGVKNKLGVGAVSVCRAGGKVRRVALCSGAWDDDLTLHAKKAGADTIVTGEIKHSAMLLALALGLNVVAAGHFATENVICAKLAGELKAAFHDVDFEVAQSNQNPAYFL